MRFLRVSFKYRAMTLIFFQCSKRTSCFYKWSKRTSLRRILDYTVLIFGEIICHVPQIYSTLGKIYLPYMPFYIVV